MASKPESVLRNTVVLCSFANGGQSFILVGFLTCGVDGDVSERCPVRGKI